LVHPDFNKPFFIETDASDFALGAILLQMGEEGKLHPIAFYSRKFSAAEINYEIHDKELLAIVDSFQEWRHLLEGASHQVIVYTDHKNLEYFMSARILNRRQVHWNMSLSCFNFIITYCPSKQQGLSDTLSRRSFLVFKEGEAAYDQQQMTLLKLGQLQLHATTMAMTIDSSFLIQVRTTSTLDPLVLNIKHRSYYDDDNFKMLDNLLYFEEHLYILEGPLRLQIFQARHDCPAAVHFEFNNTLELVS